MPKEKLTNRERKAKRKIEKAQGRNKKRRRARSLKNGMGKPNWSALSRLRLGDSSFFSFLLILYQLAFGSLKCTSSLDSLFCSFQLRYTLWCNYCRKRFEFVW